VVLDRARSAPPERDTVEPSDSRLGAVLGRAGTGGAPLLRRVRALLSRNRDSEPTDRRLGAILGAVLGAPRTDRRTDPAEPAEPADDRRTGPLVGPLPPAGRRRLAELGAAAGVVAVALALVGATLTFGRPATTPPGPGLPAPAEESVITTDPTGRSTAPRPGPGSTAGSTVARVPGRPAPTVYVPPASGAATPSAVPTTRVSAPVLTPTPRPTTPPPTPSPTPAPTPSPAPSPTPTDTGPPGTP
jgi:hypothetical protein